MHSLKKRLMVAVFLIVALPSSASAHTILIGQAHSKASETASKCAVIFTPNDYRWYASRVYRRDEIHRRALKRLRAMHICQPSYEARKKVGALHRKFYRARLARIRAAQRAAQRSVITPLMSCIIRSESGGNPLASNGTHFGIGQWSYATWAAHGGLKYGPDPRNATFWQQVEIMANGIRINGCNDWCPYDPC